MSEELKQELDDFLEWWYYTREMIREQHNLEKVIEGDNKTEQEAS